MRFTELEKRHMRNETDPAKRSVGRPLVSDDKRMASRITVNMTEAQMVALKRAATKAGVSVTQFVRSWIDEELS